MNRWTDSALHALEGYLERNRRQADACGADTDEVVSDLRRHVEAEVADLRLVTEDDVERVVTRIGPVPADPPREPRPITPVVEPRRPFRSRWLAAVCLLFGIILPAGVLS